MFQLVYYLVGIAIICGCQTHYKWKIMPRSIQCYRYEEKFYVDASQKMFWRQIVMLQALVEIITKIIIFCRLGVNISAWHNAHSYMKGNNMKPLFCICYLITYTLLYCSTNYMAGHCFKWFLKSEQRMKGKGQLYASQLRNSSFWVSLGMVFPSVESDLFHLCISSWTCWYIWHEHFSGGFKMVF